MRQRGDAIEGAVAVDRERHAVLSTLAPLRSAGCRRRARPRRSDLEAPVALRDGAAHVVAETVDIARERVVTALA